MKIKPGLHQCLPHRWISLMHLYMNKNGPQENCSKANLEQYSNLCKATEANMLVTLLHLPRCLPCFSANTSPGSELYPFSVCYWILWPSVVKQSYLKLCNPNVCCYFMLILYLFLKTLAHSNCMLSLPKLAKICFQGHFQGMVKYWLLKPIELFLILSVF